MDNMLSKKKILKTSSGNKGTINPLIQLPIFVLTSKGKKEQQRHQKLLWLCSKQLYKWNLNL